MLHYDHVLKVLKVLRFDLRISVYNKYFFCETIFNSSLTLHSHLFIDEDEMYNNPNLQRWIG